ncbi:MAG TPA: SurA N-terminal domain-containing protein [Luteimonas sp.]|nr:SurA N-terminal domain-containing protein [Luteimonas sp.]
MLQKLRDKTSGWIATVILGLLVVPFAFFGMEQYLFQRSDTYVAKIEAPPKWWQAAPAFWPVTMLWQRDEIDTDAFRSAFEQARQQQRQQQGEKFDSRAFEAADNKRNVLDGLIDQRVLKMVATRAGIAVGDAQVRDTIQGIPAFQIDGKFDPQSYQLALASQVPQRSPREFEQMVRESLQQSLIPTHVAQSAFATPSELDRLMKLLGEKRDVAYVTLPSPAPDIAAVTAAEIQHWYDAHVADYRAPETVSIEYVDIDGSKLPVSAVADDAALRQRYDQEKARFVEPEQRLASHILIKVDAGASAAVQKAAEQKAAQLAEQARQPSADFAALARANSDDSGSKVGGGDLGWVAKGVMVKPFEEALFKMQPGAIVGPVKTDFGWHVIQLREVKAGTQVPFEQVREQLAKEQADTDRERAFNDLSGKLVDQVYKNPTTLAPAARALNLSVQKIGPFARGQGTGIAASPAVQRAAFSDTLMQDGTVSDPIEIAPEHSVLIRVTEHTQAHALPLAQVSQRVIAAIRGDRAAKAGAAAADAMVAQLQSGKPLSELAAARQLQPNALPGLQRGVPVPDAGTAEAIFAAPPPAAGKVSAGKAALADGQVVVFTVSKVTPGNPKEATTAQRMQLGQQLAQLAGGDDAQALVKALRKRMKITVAEDRL